MCCCIETCARSAEQAPPCSITVASGAGEQVCYVARTQKDDGQAHVDVHARRRDAEVLLHHRRQLPRYADVLVAANVPNGADLDSGIRVLRAAGLAAAFDAPTHVDECTRRARSCLRKGHGSAPLCESGGIVAATTKTFDRHILASAMTGM